MDSASTNACHIQRRSFARPRGGQCTEIVWTRFADRDLADSRVIVAVFAREIRSSFALNNRGTVRGRFVGIGEPVSCKRGPDIHARNTPRFRLICVSRGNGPTWCSISAIWLWRIRGCRSRLDYSRLCVEPVFLESVSLGLVHASVTKRGWCAGVCVASTE